MPKHPGGRPPIYTAKKKKEIIDKLEKYIEQTAIPIVAEFAYQNDIRKSTLYDFEEFSHSMKKLIAKKEAQLEKLALAGKVNPTFAIFSLKQVGWSDKMQTENVNVNKTKVIVIEGGDGDSGDGDDI